MEINSLEGEIWKEIPNFSNYMVSNKGRVFAKERIVGNRYRGIIVKKSKLLSLSNCLGYLICRLVDDKGKVHFCRVHRLVALAFIPNPENKPHINHKDGVKNNNVLENLEWCTDLENSQHAWSMGLMPCGEKLKKSKLKESDVISIRTTERDISLSKLAKKYGVSFQTISQIKNNKIWNHLKT